MIRTLGGVLATVATVTVAGIGPATPAVRPVPCQAGTITFQSCAVDTSGVTILAPDDDDDDDDDD